VGRALSLGRGLVGMAAMPMKDKHQPQMGADKTISFICDICS